MAAVDVRMMLPIFETQRTRRTQRINSLCDLGVLCILKNLDPGPCDAFFQQRFDRLGNRLLFAGLQLVDRGPDDWLMAAGG